jgi:hypothetical protein
MTRSVVALVLAGPLLGGCSAPQLPPGTPPPEYETRTLPPWPGAAAGAAGLPSNGAPEPADTVSPQALPPGPGAAGAGGSGSSPSPAVPLE